MKSLIICLTLVLLFASCINTKELGIESAAKQLRAGMEKLGEDAKQFDPLKFGKLLDENAQLRANMEAIQKAYIKSTTGAPTIRLNERELQFEVAECRGEFEVILYIDNPKNWVWDPQRITSQVVSELPIDYSAVLAREFRSKIVQYNIGMVTAKLRIPYSVSLNNVPPNWNIVEDMGALFDYPEGYKLEDFRFAPYKAPLVNGIKTECG